MPGQFVVLVLLTFSPHLSALRLSGSTRGHALPALVKKEGAAMKMFRDGDTLPTCKEQKGENAQFSTWAGCWDEADHIRMTAGNLQEESATCGFMDKTSTLQKPALIEKFGHCNTVVYTMAIGGSGMTHEVLPPRISVDRDFEQLASEFKPVCSVFFTDSTIEKKIQKNKNYNGSHLWDWEIFVVDPVPFPGDAPRSAHAIKWLGPMMFPQAKRSLVFDTKTNQAGMANEMFRMKNDTGGLVELSSKGDFVHDANDLSSDAIVRLLNRKDYGVLLWAHPEEDRDLNGEFPRTIQHMKDYNSANLKMELADIERTRDWLQSTGYNFKGTGMADYFKVIFNHEKPCMTYAFCMLHNSISFLSMRDQLFFPYIFDALGIYDDIAWAGNRKPPTRSETYEPFPGSDQPIRPRARIGNIQC